MILSLLVITFSIPMFIFFATQVYHLWQSELKSTGPGSSRRTRCHQDLGPNLLSLSEIVRLETAF